MLSRAASVRTRVARATRALPCAALAISSRRSTASSARAEPMPNSPTVVLSWGSDSTSALGNGNLDLFRSTPYPIAFPPNAYAPAPHSAAADSAGGAPASARASPVLPGEEIVDVATSWTSTLAVTSSGAVYQWGSLWTLRDAISAAMFRARTPRFYRFLQRFTSLGRLVNVGLAPRPRQLPIFGAQTPQDFDKKVGGSQVSLTSDSVFDPASVRATRVAVGAEASAAVTEAGFLYTWSTSGDTVGTLGRKLSSLPADPVDMSVPALLARVTGASQLSARSLTAPAPVPALLGHKVVDVAMGFHHLLALTDTGEVFACGKAETGALGVPLAFVSRKEARFVEEPVSVTEAVKAFMGDLKDAAQLEQVKQEQALARRRADAAAAAAASPSSSSAAAAAAAAAANASSAFAAKGAADPVTTVGALGELGRITAIAAGFSHSAFLDDRGRLWTCGKNTHGELGLLVALGGDAVERLDFRLNYVPTRVRALDGHKVVKVSCGAHHTAVLTSAGEVLTWGSNKYGQCGRPHEAPVAGSGGQRTGQQAWSLPPGAVRVAAVGGKDPDTGRVVRIVDIACGPYDTALTLSNGRVVMCGTYLEEKGTHRPPFAVAEFDSTATAAAAPAPAPVAAGAVDHGAGRSLVSLASADAVAPHVAKLDSTPSTGAGAAGVRDRFFATKVVLGLGHAYAFAKKRE